jgi:hypothetical protein
VQGQVQSIAIGDALSRAKHTDATATDNVRIFILLVGPFADRSYHFVIAVWRAKEGESYRVKYREIISE